MPKLSVKQADQQLIKFALTYPRIDARSPMGARRGEGKGEDVHDLRGEANPKNAFSLSAKLPVSSETAMTLLWVEPTGYGHGAVGLDDGAVEGGR